MHGLRTQIGLILLVLTGATALLVGLPVLNLVERSVLDRLMVVGQRLTEASARSLVDSYRPDVPLADEGNREAVDGVAAIYVDGGLMVRIELYDANGILVTSFPSGEGDTAPSELHDDLTVAQTSSNVRLIDHPTRGLEVVTTVSIHHQAELNGFLRGFSSVEESRKAIELAQLFTVLYAAMAAFLALIMGYLLLTRVIVTPIRRLGIATQRVAAGDIASRVEMRGHNEISALATSFNHMMERIEANKETLENQLRQLKEAKQGLERAQKAVVRGEKLASVGRLAAGIAHEVGNPLSAMLGLVELLQDDEGWDGEERTDLLKRLEREILRIHEIIRELLAYSRGQDKLPIEAAVDDVLDHAHSLVGAQPKFKNVELIVECPEDLPLVRANPDQLLQVVVNLLLNAADAVEGNGRIEVTASQQVDGVVIEVADTGPGIPPHVADKIFEPFFTTKAPGQGTGLGLAICEQIVEGFEGRLNVENSDDSSGARFVVFVPRLGIAD